MFKYGQKEILEQEIATIFKKQLMNKPNSILCLSTGNSPVGIYQRLIDFYQREQISFKKVTTYNLDEYLEIDPQTSPLSFRNFMADKLFNHIDIDKENTFFPKEPKEYDAKLDSISGFDLALVGVGSNGHIAFNEPGVGFLRTNVVKLAQSTINDNFKGIEHYPTTSITMGLKDIYEKSQRIILIAWGESKREALTKFKQAKLANKKDDNWPITHFIDHPNFEIYTNLEI